MMSETILNLEEMHNETAALLEAARASENEEQFKINAEIILERLCRHHGVFWNSYTYEHAFPTKKRYVDAIHGSTVIEYEPPRSFKSLENKRLQHARSQAEDYARLLSEEEGRELERYSLVAWDGESISFGHFNNDGFDWEPLRSFDGLCLQRLLSLIADGGRPLVSPMLLKQFIGPDTEVGRTLLPALFDAVTEAKRTSSTTRTKLIYMEWVRLFGQVDGTETERLAQYLDDVSRSHNVDYTKDPQAYVFALSTYIALVAKICAVYALASQSDVVLNPSSNPRRFLKEMEAGEFFKRFGIENMLGTDFFSWYLGDDIKSDFIEQLGMLLERLRTIDFNVAQKSPESVRDLFKGLYMGFTPSPMRHALGEYYTPDWLASHVLNVAGWNADQSLLDPTCGSGTFLLEGLRRRLEAASDKESARELLDGLYGCDLNPLAVLTARASIVVFLSGRFNPSDPVLLPVFLADAINTADPNNGVFTHSILTEKGKRTFSIPVPLAESSNFLDTMDNLRTWIDANLPHENVMSALKATSKAVRDLNDRDEKILAKTVEDLIDLHRNHWNGIWCLILFDRIKAGCIHDVDLVAGNPPWVKWSNLPRPYAEFIKPICDRMSIFSDDVWVGGIQSDISTVITYHALARFVKSGGSLAFLITGTVFKNESSQGFRRWKLRIGDKSEDLTVERVEDYALLHPFEGVANWPTLLLIRRNGRKTRYPVDYVRYSRRRGKDSLPSLNSFDCLKAMPVPGSDAGPWLVGTADDIKIWPSLFDASEPSQYKARKGITTDLNGVFFVDASPDTRPNRVLVSNDPKNGRKKGVTKRTASIEYDDVFPLLRGRDIDRFVARLPQSQCVIVPQRGMFGDESLPATRPLTFKFLSNFKDILEKRSSYRRFQKGKPFWSIWSTGDYTFAPYKVVWKEMSGGGFVAAYVHDECCCGRPKTVIPDHKVYFVPLESEEEAAYLTAFLNSKIVAAAIDAYSSALSLGTSVVDYLQIPKYDSDNEDMVALSSMAKRFRTGSVPTIEDEKKMDCLVMRLIHEGH